MSQDSVQSLHPGRKPFISVSSPCFQNPNSYDRLKSVLNHIQDVGNLNDDEQNVEQRNWLSVVCDGLPYTMVQKLINRDPSKYGWLLLRPGGGHIEMNMVRAFFLYHGM